MQSKTTFQFSTISHLCDSDERMLRKLLSRHELGDRRPSVALRHLQRLAPNSAQLVKLRFYKILPESVRVVLVSLPDLNLETMAEVADKMVEQLFASKVNKIEFEPQCTDMKMLQAAVANLTEKINAIGTERRHD